MKLSFLPVHLKAIEEPRPFLRLAILSREFVQTLLAQKYMTELNREELHKLRQLMLDNDNCHDKLDGIVPRQNNAGEIYTLYGRLEILIAAVEFAANVKEEAPLPDQVRLYRKSPGCPLAYAPIDSRRKRGTPSKNFLWLAAEGIKEELVSEIQRLGADIYAAVADTEEDPYLFLRTSEQVAIGLNPDATLQAWHFLPDNCGTDNTWRAMYCEKILAAKGYDAALNEIYRSLNSEPESTEINNGLPAD